MVILIRGWIAHTISTSPAVEKVTAGLVQTNQALVALADQLRVETTGVEGERTRISK